MRFWGNMIEKNNIFQTREIKLDLFFLGITMPSARYFQQEIINNSRNYSYSHVSKDA